MRGCVKKEKVKENEHLKSAHLRNVGEGHAGILREYCSFNFSESLKLEQSKNLKKNM